VFFSVAAAAGNASAVWRNRSPAPESPASRPSGFLNDPTATIATFEFRYFKAAQGVAQMNKVAEGIECGTAREWRKSQPRPGEVGCEEGWRWADPISEQLFFSTFHLTAA
jgi:hypothetical protein